MITKNELPSSPKMKGTRLKRLRLMANLERTELKQKYGVSIDSLKGWETGRHGGLTTKAATKLLTIFHEYGVIANLAWLMDGVGTEPAFVSPQYINITDQYIKLDIQEKHENECITQELVLLQNHYPNLIHCQIEDDAMLPDYEVGDIVAGIPINDKLSHLLVGQICLIELTSYKKILRKILQIKKNNTYVLGCKNLSTTKVEPILNDIPVNKIAKIFWHRKLICNF